MRQGLGLQRDPAPVGGGERVDGQDPGARASSQTGRSRSHWLRPRAPGAERVRGPVQVSRCASVLARGRSTQADPGSRRWDAGPCRRPGTRSSRTSCRLMSRGLGIQTQGKREEAGLGIPDPRQGPSGRSSPARRQRSRGRGLSHAAFWLATAMMRVMESPSPSSGLLAPRWHSIPAFQREHPTRRAPPAGVEPLFGRHGQ